MTKLKITDSKKNFESLIIRKYGLENLYSRKYKEEKNLLTLYYDKRLDSLNAHVGTWSAGNGWLFKSVEDARAYYANYRSYLETEGII
tara:strand:+ start:491 stop:754 length:264 start_codon:yes stop_codon:yes gene_type:complete